MMKIHNLYFLVESGKAREIAEKHIQQLIDVRNSNIEYLNQFPNCIRLVEDNFNKQLCGLVFEGEIPKGFRKPNRRGISFPKKGSKWEKEMKALPKCDRVSEIIRKAFNIPISMDYESSNGTTVGGMMIGHPFLPCGVFFNDALSGDMAIYIPDVQKYVAKEKATGAKVKEPANSYIPIIDGARQITEDEWELLCLQRKVANQKSEVA